MKKFGLTTRIMIGLKRYRRLSEELIFTILFEYQHTAASFVAKTYGISKATVYNLVNSFEMPKLNKEKENVSQRRKDQMKMLHFLCKLRQGEEKA